MINREVIKRIDDLILDDGYTAYDKLPSYAIDELTALTIRAMGSSAYEVLVECKKADDNISDLIHFLINGDYDSAAKLATTLRNNAVDYCEKSLEEAFNERAGDLECERNREAGLHPIVDHINGETRWVR